MTTGFVALFIVVALAYVFWSAGYSKGYDNGYFAADFEHDFDRCPHCGEDLP